MSICLSARDTTSLCHCLKNKQLKLKWTDPAKGVFSIIHSYFETQYTVFARLDAPPRLVAALE